MRTVLTFVNTYYTPIEQDAGGGIRTHEGTKPQGSDSRLKLPCAIDQARRLPLE